MQNEKKSLLERLVRDWPAKVLSVAGALILFLFNRMTGLKQENFMVPLAVTGSERFMPVDEYQREVNVTVRGEESEIGIVKDRKDVQAYVDLSGVMEEGSLSFPVKLRKIGSSLNADPLELSVEPISIRLTLESAATAVLPIEARFRGSPEAGYERVGHQISPPSAEIRGPRSVVAGIKTVRTVEVDMTGVNADMDAQAPLEAPSPFVVLSNSGSVRISVTVRQALAVKTFEALRIEAKGLRPWLELAAPMPEGLLKVQGAQETLRGFIPAEGTLSVDLSGVDSPGIRVFPVKAELGSEFEAISVEPATIELVIKERD